MSTPDFSRIRAVLTDVDGVLTDGHLYLSAEGESLKRFHVHDGVGTKLLLAAGIEVAWVTSRESAVNLRRAQELGVVHVLQKVEEKGAAVREFLKQKAILPEHALFIGDDVIDIPAFREVGLPVATADGHPDAQAAARYVTQKRGGEGAFREVADRIIAARS